MGRCSAGAFGCFGTSSVILKRLQRRRWALRVRFGDCVFDAESRLVTRRGGPLPLSPKGFALLHLLIEKRPGAVPRQELQDLLWPETFVAHTSLARVVSELRTALGDDPKEPRFIRTVHGFGYAFAGEASGAEVPWKGVAFPCSLLWGTREIPLIEGENLIGRAVECVVRIDGRQVSRRHARIEITRRHAMIEDLGSKNGTLVGGRRIASAVALREGDDITIGSVVLIYRGSAGDGSTQTRTRSKGPR